jgi:uncharacterized membrane protein
VVGTLLQEYDKLKFLSHTRREMKKTTCAVVDPIICLIAVFLPSPTFLCVFTVAALLNKFVFQAKAIF